MKKILLFFLALLPIVASADDSGSCGENVTYTFVEATGTLTISGTGAMTDNTDSSSAPWSSYRKNIQNVIVTNGVTSIGNYAFYYCSGLTSVTIPNSVESIGEWAFRGCSGLTSVTIPNSVTSIGWGAFMDCSGLTSVTIPNSVTSIAGSAFMDCSGLTSLTIGNSVTSIGNQAFEGCSGLTSISVESGNTVYDSRKNCNAIIEKTTNTLVVGCKNTVIPNSVTSIAGSAFRGCSGLTSVTIPNSVTSIAGNAFSGCSGLTSITVESGNTVYDSRENCNAIIKTSTNELVVGCKNTIIPNGVTSIGSYAFEACSGLTSVTIPNSVTSIGSSAFYGCSGLTSVTCLAENVPNTSSNAFSSYNIQNATLLVPAGSIEAYQAAAPWSGFGNIMRCDDSGSCGDNVTYTFDATTGTLTISGTGAMTNYTNTSSRPWFSYIDAIKTVVVTNGVTSIGDYAFYGCSGLTSVNIPNSVTAIGYDAFFGCSGLTSITVESGNTVYDSRENCNAIIKTSTNKLVVGCKNTVIPNSVTSIGNYAFEGCSGLTSITIPNSVTSIGIEAFSGCSGLTSITVESGNTMYDSRENCNAIIKTSTNELVVGCKNTVIPNSVTSIGNYAFEGCSGLTSITIPNSVTSIGIEAFSGCSGLTSITIPNSVTTIGNYAFYECSGLTSITIPNSVTSISGYAFYGCSGLTSVTIPNSVTSIFGRAFAGCSGLTSVTIGNCVTSIGDYAFQGCSGLTSVTCLAENVPTTESNVFSNYYIQNATLVVPAGSVAAYQAAAPWSGFGQITDQTDISQIDNVIYIEPFEARPGRAEREVSIKMKNTAAIRGFQFDLVLPEGVTPVTSGASIFRKLNNSRFPKDDFDERYHTLNISLQSDGSYRFLCGSTQDQTFIGNDGEIIMLKVNVDENQAERDYPIILKNIRLTESDINNYYDIDVLLSKMTVLNYMIGDINGDNAVNVSDYIGVANHILGNTPNGFNAVTADVNEDNVIDVSDYIGIANIILTGSIYGNNNAAPAFEEDAELDPQ